MFGLKKKAAAGPPTTPLLPGEPQSLGFQPDDSLFTIQGKVDKQTTDSRKAPEMTLIQWSEVVSKPASEQCKFFLNAYWPYLQEGQAKRVYQEWKIFKIVQKESGTIPEDSPSVHQALALVFLQRLKRGLSKAEFDASFKQIDSNFDGQMAFGEYLCWDYKKTPADVIYRPQRYSSKIASGIKRVLAAERALLEFDYKLAELTEKASQEGTAGLRGINEKEQFEKNANVQGLNAEAASAKEALLKAWVGDKEPKPPKEEGDAFWEAALANEAKETLSQKQQASMRS